MRGRRRSRRASFDHSAGPAGSPGPRDDAHPDGDPRCPRRDASPPRPPGTGVAVGTRTLSRAEHASWAAGRTLGAQQAIIAASRNYGLYSRADGEQVAYARVVTDGVTFAWLADVIVDPAHRGRRLGAALVDRILEDLDPMGLKRIVLKASEAGRPLYEWAGWTPLEGPDDWMELRSR